jgi:hypothetical protein
MARVDLVAVDAVNALALVRGVVPCGCGLCAISGADPAARRVPWWSLDPSANRLPAFLPVTAKGETPVGKLAPWSRADGRDEPMSFVGLRRRPGHGYVAIMPGPRAKSYLHVTETGIERRPFSGLTLDQLQQMVGDGSGQCRLGLTYRYFANPVLLIANDDAYAHTDLPVTAVINDVLFQGALVILAERSVDPDAPPLQEDTFLDGLTPRECQQALLSIKPPASLPPDGL